MRLSRLFLRSAFMALLFLVPSAARADDVAPGHDLFEAVADLSNHSFANNPIPAGFFDPGSDPFLGNILLQGGQIDPLPACPGDDLFGIDAIIRRPGSAALPVIPSSDQIPIEIVELRLVSVQPFQVLYGGGSPEDWILKVELSPSIAQPQGHQWFFHTDPNGGTSDMYLPVVPKFTFTRLSDNAVRGLDYGLTGPVVLELSENGAPWVHNTPPPSSCTSNLCMSPEQILVLSSPSTTLVLGSRCPQPPVQAEARTWGRVKAIYR